MNCSKITAFALLVGIASIAISSMTSAQEPGETTATSSPLDDVKRISQLSGRPIFAVAGQST